MPVELARPRPTPVSKSRLRCGAVRTSCLPPSQKNWAQGLVSGWNGHGGSPVSKSNANPTSPFLIATAAASGRRSELIMGRPPCNGTNRIGRHQPAECDGSIAVLRHPRAETNGAAALRR